LVHGLADGSDARRGGVGARAHEPEREAGGFAEVVGNHQVTDAADGDAQGETGGDAVEDRPQRQPGPTDDGEPEGEAAGDAAQQEIPPFQMANMSRGES